MIAFPRYASAQCVGMYLCSDPRVNDVDMWLMIHRQARIAAIPIQYSGFGGFAEWRIQDAELEKPGNTVWLGILYFQVTNISTDIKSKGQRNQTSTPHLQNPDTCYDASFR